MAHLASVIREGIMYGMTDLITAAVKSGADINKQNENGKTPLLFALEIGSESAVIRRLIVHGADVNVCNEFQEPALLYALSSGYCTEVIKLLIDAGADVNARDGKCQRSCLMSIKYGCCDGKFKCFNIDRLVLLLGKGADVSVVDEIGNTVLHSVGCRCALNLFLGCGIPLEIKNRFDQTPLMTAVIQNKILVLEELLSKGADVNCKDAKLNTPLHCARDCRIIYKLMYAGANLNALNLNNERPLISLLKRFGFSNSVQSPAHAFVKLALLIDEKSVYFNDIREFLVKKSLFSSFYRFVSRCQTEIQRMRVHYLIEDEDKDKYDDVSYFDLCTTDDLKFRKNLNHFELLEANKKCLNIAFLFRIFGDLILMKLEYYGFCNNPMKLINPLNLGRSDYRELQPSMNLHNFNNNLESNSFYHNAPPLNPMLHEWRI